MILRPKPSPCQAPVRTADKLFALLDQLSLPPARRFALLDSLIPDLLEPLEYVRGLQRFLPLDFVLAALRQTAKLSKRQRRLPAHCVVWLVVAQGLLRDRGLPQVWRFLHKKRQDKEPADSAFSQARQRLGERPLRLLFRQLVAPVGSQDSPGVFFNGLRVLALDGSIFELPDTPANRAAFGSSSNQHGEAGFPQMRLAALCEVGTHTIIDVEFGRYDRSEPSLCARLLNRLSPNSLLLMDRGLSYYWLLRAAVQRGCAVLARVKAGRSDLPVEEVLPDGSYRTHLYPSAKARRAGQGGIAVRVLRYSHSDPDRAGCGEVTCLITTVADVKQMSAREAIRLYPWRWEEESAFREVKETLLLNKQPLLRSKTPALVVQEVYGLLLTHWLVRKMMAEAAVLSGVCPARLSCKHSLEVLKDQMKEPVRGQGVRWYKGLLLEVSQQKLRKKRERSYKRERKSRTQWPRKKVGQGPPKQPSMPFEQAVVIEIPQPPPTPPQPTPLSGGH
jgi:hypothetical protein